MRETRVLKRLVGYLIVMNLIFLNMWWSSLPAPTSPIKPPAYGSPVLILNGNKQLEGYANAFLVDRELGLLITNAHVVADAKNWRLKLGGKWYFAKFEKRWINESADLAILRLDHYRPGDLPVAANLSGSVFVGLAVQARGYTAGHYDSFLPDHFYCSDNQVTAADASWGAVMVLMVRINRFLNGEGLDPSDLVFYRHYIFISGHWWTRNVIRRGCSGSPVLRKDGGVIGIVSQAHIIAGTGVLIPSWEIRKLLDRVRKELKNRR